jgi:hypothetical protein
MIDKDITILVILIISMPMCIRTRPFFLFLAALSSARANFSVKIDFSNALNRQIFDQNILHRIASRFTVRQLQ